MKPYLFLATTILLESAAILFMKQSHGFQHKLNAIAAIICYAASFLFLTLALKHLPMGWANAVWAGSSTLIVAVIGIVWMKEQVSFSQWIYLLFILVGLVGLNLSGKSA